VQLDASRPAYALRIGALGNETIPATRSGGAGCSGTVAVPVYPLWASTGELAHTAGNYALVDSQTDLSPIWNTTSRWNLSPS